MSEYAGKFDRIFMERTKDIIENVETKHKFTLLLNCTLSLICQPIEKLNTNIIENRGRKAKNYEIIDQVASVLKKYNRNLNGSNLQILRCLRNGIAHLNISHTNSNGYLDKFIITGETKTRKGIVIKNTFEYTQNDLKNLSLEFLDIYLSYAE